MHRCLSVGTLSCQRGNALFLILIAVALFAGLSYAVTSSGRSSGGEISKEKTILAASQAIEYGGLLQNAIDRLRVVNGCADNQISFENAIVTGYTNAGAPLDRRCHVLDPAGGGLTSLTPPPSINDGSPWFFRANRVWLVGPDKTYCTETASTPCTELNAYLKNVTDAACIELNRRLNKVTTITTQDNGTAYDSVKFTGSYANSGDLDGANVEGKYAACTRGVDGSNYFFTVLIAR